MQRRPEGTPRQGISITGVHPILFLKDHIGRIRSLSQFQQGQEVEHREARERRYTRARVVGVSKEADARLGGKYVSVNNVMQRVPSSDMINQNQLDQGTHIVRKVGLLRRHIRPIKKYSYE